MAVKTCRQCRRAYWRYPSSDWPPDGTCGQLCHELYTDERHAGHMPQPAELLREIRTHRQIAHRTTNLKTWFPDCDECERLEESYAAALNYYAPIDAQTDNEAAA